MYRNPVRPDPIELRMHALDAFSELWDVAIILDKYANHPDTKLMKEMINSARSSLSQVIIP